MEKEYAAQQKRYHELQKKIMRIKTSAVDAISSIQQNMDENGVPYQGQP